MKPLRSIWKGHIRFSLVTIPIRIYNAVDTAQSALVTDCLAGLRRLEDSG